MFHNSTSKRNVHSQGLVLIELILVVMIILLMLSIALPNLLRGREQRDLNEDVKKFVKTLRQTAEAAMLEGRYFDILIDITDGYYTVYEINAEVKKNADDATRGPEFNKTIDGVDVPWDAASPDFTTMTPVIERQGLDECYIEQILFLNAATQYSGELILHATPSGWKQSVVFDLIDVPNKNWRFVRCDAMTARVTYSAFPLELLETRESVSMTNVLQD